MRPDFARDGGLIRAVVQDASTKAVLMDAYMNEKAYDETIRTGRAVYYTRTRKKLWRKGEESGNVQIVRSIDINCNRDSVLLTVEQIGGAACHDGYQSCFYRRIASVPPGCREGLQAQEPTISEERLFDPAVVYKK